MRYRINFGGSDVAENDGKMMEDGTNIVFVEENDNNSRERRKRWEKGWRIGIGRT